MAAQQKPVVSPNWKHGDCFYFWQANGMLERVKRPDGTEISFEYDALGRRTAKINEATKEITRFVWDGNVPLHEWKYNLSDRPQIVANELGELFLDKRESTENLITWIFDEGSFVPSAKITAEDTFSIVSDYLGTPCLMYNSVGNLVWQADLDIYGKVRTLGKGNINDCPFRYQGQYHDTEVDLHYNRFRYYSPESGMYMSQDPIGLSSGEPNFYAYVPDSNNWIDPFGLTLTEWNITRHGSQPSPRSPYQSHHLIQDQWAKSQNIVGYDSRDAPSILLDSTKGDSNKHAIITNRQNARRDARIAEGKGKWSTTFKEEFDNMVDDLRAAGVSDSKIEEAKKAVNKYFKGCK